MIKKLLVLLLLCSSAFGQWQSGIKPTLGRQINWGHPLSRGLVGCWLMNEGSGNIVNDLSGNGHTGSLVADTHFVAGKFGPALSFDGTGDYVNVPIQLNTGSYTWSFWSYTNTVQQMWFMSGDTLTSGWGIGCWDATGVFRVYSGSDSNRWVSAAGVVQAGVWQHFCVVYNGSIMSNVYLNGISLTPASNNSTTPITSATAMRIAGRPGTVWVELLGKIDNVMIYNRALSAQEISQLYIDPFGMFKPAFDLYLIGGIVIPGISGGQVIMIGEF